jgi:hypothetical protein
VQLVVTRHTLWGDATVDVAGEEQKVVVTVR